jgi:hypothetical protein
MVNPVLASSAISVVPPQRSGMASGANNTFRQVGIATGIAVLGAMFQSQIAIIAPSSPSSGWSRRSSSSGNVTSWSRSGKAVVAAMPEPFVLEGTFVRLEPLSEVHIPALVVAAAEDRTSYQWTYTPRVSTR